MHDSNTGTRWRLAAPRYWHTWLGLAMLWLLAQTPYRFQLWLGRGLGRAMLRIAPGRRHVAETNIRLCFPQLSTKEQDRLLRRNFESTAIALLETGIAWFWPKWRLRRLVSIEGLEHIEQARDRGKLLLAMHMTTLDICAALLNLYVPVDGVYRAHKNPVFDFVQYRGRSRVNPAARIYPREQVRTFVNALREKRLLWYAPDQNYRGKHSVFVPFFGVPAATTTATSSVVSLGHAVVIPFTHTRRADGRGYDLKIHPPWTDFPSGDERADTRTVMQFIERQVALHPEQYLWVHRRFKTQPDGAPSPYLQVQNG